MSILESAVSLGCMAQFCLRMKAGLCLQAKAGACLGGFVEKLIVRGLGAPAAGL